MRGVATRVGTFAPSFDWVLVQAWKTPALPLLDESIDDEFRFLGLMMASSSLRMEIEASSSFKKEGHGRRVGAWARGGVAHGRRWHGSLRPSGGITYRTI